MSSKRPAAPPPRIPGFSYVSLLGSGGFSDVYLYEQDRPRRKVAVKVLLSGLKTEGARRRFESEANLMAQLSSHPFIVTIFEAEVTEDGHSYLAMEYCSRPSLDVRYRRQRFSVDEVLAVGIQVASAVETAHRAGIAHRDIKPANILVTDYNRPALTDFGISGTLAGDVDEDAGMSIPWSPPEQFRDGNVDGVMVDVWALGATLYTLLAGRSPFVLPGADNSQRELISRITSMPVPRLGRADVPESLELALATAMAKSPASRYSSAHAFALSLQRIQAELNLSVTPFEVLEERHQEDVDLDDGVEETRVRNVASIDPDRTGSAPFPARTKPLDGGAAAGTPPELVPGPAAPAPGPARVAPQGTFSTAGAAASREPAAVTPADDWAGATVLRSNQPKAAEDDAPGQAGDQPADHGKRNLWLAISGGTLLVLAVIVGIVVASAAPQTQARPTETVSKPPADAVDDGSVPDVAKLAGSAGAQGKVRFTWTNPQPKPGDMYKWRIKTVKGGGSYLSTSATRVDVTANPAEPTCVQVILVRSDGTASPAGEDSIACL
ncbi:serine/threonine-protein kinase [Arthrobacter sp. AFG20]|uniref:serine/threonine-protein kinase n=1 Tax=Arthrobacter sp. AFG20 TaxID=1688671 RepID=UPI000C9E4836|nr:serine/threonine-protein kinase [Arthrobacter sp. AFG20]PNH86589.1 serine/threonine protein kinase [Arthrobacter sp. AFG20]